MTDLAAILESSDRNNGRAKITGGLLINGRQIFQVLEGKGRAVDMAFRRICGDSRHEDIRQVWSGEVKGRLFEGWAVAAVSVDPSVRLDLARLIDEASLNPHSAVSALVDLIGKQRSA